MILERDNCKFSIVDHTKISTNLNMSKIVKLTTIIDQKEVKLYFTNKGWMKENNYSWFCPAKFYQRQAEKFILGLPKIIYAD